MNIWMLAGLACTVLIGSSYASAQEDTGTKACSPSGDLAFICGVKNPEDLIALPGNRWIIASGMAAKSGLHLIDADNKRAERWIAPVSKGAKAPFDQCPSQPHPDELQVHGISLRNLGNGQAILYAVNHSGLEDVKDLSVGRGHETIEVFNVSTNGPKPQLSWQGCIPLPGKLVANGVVSGADGAVYATVMLHPDNTPNDLWSGKPTGAVYKWTPGTTSFQRMAGTELTGNNGIELSRDGRTLYVAGMQVLVKFTNTSPAVRIRNTRIPNGVIDNIHWVGEKLLATGPRTDICTPNTQGVPCLAGYRTYDIDPETLATTTVAEGVKDPSFPAASVAVPIGNTLWLGSYAADRIAYRLLK